MSDRPIGDLDRLHEVETPSTGEPLSTIMEDELLFRAVMGRATEGEAAAVSRWRGQSPETEARLQEIVDVLLITGRADDELRFQAAPPAEALLGKARGTRRRLQRAWRGLGGGRSRFLMATAAMAILVLSTSLLRDGPESDLGSQASLQFGSDEFTTEAESATVGLRDGTLVRMAPESRLRVHSGEGVREVSLAGRGYFAVARDPERRFVVRSEAGTVTVLGTRFDLTVDGEALRVIVIEGSVSLTVRGTTVEVGAGQMAQAIRGHLVPPVDVPDPESLIGWVGNFIVFQETPLRTVAAEVERRHGLRMEFTDPRLGDRTVTAWFAGRSVDEVVEVTCMVTHVRCTRMGDVLRVSPVQ